MMQTIIPAKRFLLLTVAGLLLLTGMALSVQAQGPAGGYPTRPTSPPRPIPTPSPTATPDLFPIWSVNGKLRWKKAMGVVPVSASLESSIDNRCISFYVAISDPRTGEPILGEHSQMWKAEDEGEYYVCRYTLKVPQNRQVRIFAGMGGEGLLPKPDPNPLFSRPWVGGDPSQSQVPQGAFRNFTGSRYVTLDRYKFRDTVDFELIYAFPRSDNPR